MKGVDSVNLYDRDYSLVITPEEKLALEEENAYESYDGKKVSGEAPRYTHPNEQIREFLWHKRSLFPNNHLNPITVRKLPLQEEIDEYISVLDGCEKERDIQKYIKENKKWFIPGAIFQGYSFGHHDAYLFPEQRLGAEYCADYMLLGKNSSGYSIVLVEFENVNCSFAISSSVKESEYVQKGLTQIRDWKRWLDDNRKYFLTSAGLAEKGIDIPTSQIFYCLVVGRGESLTKREKDLRSQLVYESSNLDIISYDRIASYMAALVLGY